MSETAASRPHWLFYRKTLVPDEPSSLTLENQQRDKVAILGDSPFESLICGQTFFPLDISYKLETWAHFSSGPVVWAVSYGRDLMRFWTEEFRVIHLLISKHYETLSVESFQRQPSETSIPSTQFLQQFLELVCIILAWFFSQILIELFSSYLIISSRTFPVCRCRLTTPVFLERVIIYQDITRKW